MLLPAMTSVNDLTGCGITFSPSPCGVTPPARGQDLPFALFRYRDCCIVVVRSGPQIPILAPHELKD